MSELKNPPDDFIPEDDENFETPPNEKRWGGTGPSDRNAEPLPPTVQDEEDKANADAE